MVKRPAFEAGRFLALLAGNRLAVGSTLVQPVI